MKFYKYILMAAAAAALAGCSKDDESDIKNDLIKKTLAPAIAGETIQFAYALGTTGGTITKAEAEASIAGAQGTNFESFSYFTNKQGMTWDGVRYDAGSNIPVRTVREATTQGAVSTAILMETVDGHYINPTVDPGTVQSPLVAATLRYDYVVPESAKGQNVSFRFTATSSTGAQTSYSTPSYPVSKMDIARNITLTSGDACFFSIADMKAYTQAEASSKSIDFAYIYQATVDGFAYKHSFVSGGTPKKYVPVDIPAINDTKMRRAMKVHDAQLKGDNPATYIDDVDFETLQMDEADADYVLNWNKDHGAWMVTADGKWAAYIYINSINDGAGSMVISLKRYPLK